ncbi:ABC transporter C family member 3-like isoform X1 [Typha angustifolia]|uniref:ABC transporter C family member 3-like isoform X1 n=1 Tax=Typha angustifolia TaxID=59011 RepID=UPI003C2B9DE9
MMSFLLFSGLLILICMICPHLPFVLRGLPCTFSGGMKTGIVGRTGSGKSNIVLTTPWSNPDSLEEFTDKQIWEALNCCQLGEEIKKKELKLYSAVMENGEDWSIGQRQLACLGRVIWKKSKVLILNEDTASVDTATDSLIQKTVREQFSEATVIAIVHRITSLLDSDMVLLLDNA